MLNILFILVMVVVNLFLRGIVLVDLWKWFVVPFGVMEIGIAHALGLSVIISFLTINIFTKTNDVDSLIMSVTAAIYTLIIWGMGAIFMSLM